MRPSPVETKKCKRLDAFSYATGPSNLSDYKVQMIRAVDTF